MAVVLLPHWTISGYAHVAFTRVSHNSMVCRTRGTYLIIFINIKYFPLSLVTNCPKLGFLHLLWLNMMRNSSVDHRYIYKHYKPLWQGRWLLRCKDKAERVIYFGGTQNASFQIFKRFKKLLLEIQRAILNSIQEYESLNMRLFENISL